MLGSRRYTACTIYNLHAHAPGGCSTVSHQMFTAGVPSVAQLDMRRSLRSLGTG